MSGGGAGGGMVGGCTGVGCEEQHQGAVVENFENQDQHSGEYASQARDNLQTGLQESNGQEAAAQFGGSMEAVGGGAAGAQQPESYGGANAFENVMQNGQAQGYGREEIPQQEHSQEEEPEQGEAEYNDRANEAMESMSSKRKSIEKPKDDDKLGKRKSIEKPKAEKDEKAHKKSKTTHTKSEEKVRTRRHEDYNPSNTKLPKHHCMLYSQKQNTLENQKRI
jgi:hypothetical protein